MAPCLEKTLSPWGDSNPQPPDPKSDALSIAPQGLHDENTIEKVLPGLEPGLQGSEPWVLTNYTTEPLT